jgi:hypothetical protein
MAHIDLAVEHGQSLESASRKLQAGVNATRLRFGAWIRRIDWSDSDHRADIVGPGFEIRVWVDERELRLEGKVPLAWKALETAAKHYLKRAIESKP